MLDIKLAGRKHSGTPVWFPLIIHFCVTGTVEAYLEIDLMSVICRWILGNSHYECTKFITHLEITLSKQPVLLLEV